MGTESPNTATGMTVEDYLYGCVGFDVAENAIATILVDRGVAFGTPIADVEKKSKDLCKADLYMWCASTPSLMGSVEDSNGVWRHKEGGTQSSAFDKRNLRAMANEIYRLYGETPVRSQIRITSFGMSMSKNCKR